MPKKKIDLSKVSVEKLERLIAARTAAPLKVRRAEILKELAQIERDLKRLRAGKSFREKAGRIKAAKPRRKSSPKRSPKLTVEQAAVQVIQTRGKPTAFQDILKAIVDGKLVTTKSKNFANVLRRTLAVSTKVKRVSRGVYTVA